MCPLSHSNRSNEGSLSALLVDHRDSFTRNLWDWLERAGFATTVLDAEKLCRNQSPPVISEILASPPSLLVLSPGPKTPADFAQSQHLVSLALGRVPILGICLGHQMLADGAGAELQQLPQAVHGSTKPVQWSEHDPVRNDPISLLRELGGRRDQLPVYNSLAIDPSMLPAEWRCVAFSGDEVMAIERCVAEEAPAWGWQFHPEGHLNEHAAFYGQVLLHCVQQFHAQHS